MWSEFQLLLKPMHTGFPFLAVHVQHLDVKDRTCESFELMGRANGLLNCIAPFTKWERNGEKRPQWFDLTSRLTSGVSIK